VKDSIETNEPRKAVLSVGQRTKLEKFNQHQNVTGLEVTAALEKSLAQM